MSATDGPGDAGPAWARIRPYLRARPDHDSAAPPPDPAARTPGNRPRPFVLTGGRVRAVDPEIGLETQVTARAAPYPGAPPAPGLAPELRAIIALCADPISVAEISARVPLHLGVTRVLVGDLRAAGHLDVHAQDAVDPHDPDLILRVIRGLRAIA